MAPKIGRKSFGTFEKQATGPKITSAQVVETSVNVILNSPSQDYTHSDDRTSLNYDMTPGFKPFTILVPITFHFIYQIVPNSLLVSLKDVKSG